MAKCHEARDSLGISYHNQKQPRGVEMKILRRRSTSGKQELPKGKGARILNRRERRIMEESQHKDSSIRRPHGKRRATR